MYLHSTLVRLKLKEKLCFILGALFTFHSGKIKTTTSFTTTIRLTKFTFHSGKIKTTQLQILSIQEYAFTFHSGKIKTRFKFN